MFLERPDDHPGMTGDAVQKKFGEDTDAKACFNKLERHQLVRDLKGMLRADAERMDNLTDFKIKFFAGKNISKVLIIVNGD